MTPQLTTATTGAATTGAATTGAATGVATGATAMVCVGGSVAVSSVLAGAPVFTDEAVRYGLACLLLVTLARATGRTLTRPRGTEWLWLAGIAWAAVVFGCEAAFTLLAIPVLNRHGPWGVSVHTTWLATAMFALISEIKEGPAAVTELTRSDWLAIGYLAVAVTAVAFVLWYSSVSRLGASRAGLLTGIAPVAAAASGVLLGGPAPRPLVWAGMAVVAAGLALGLRKGTR
jgi:threonine/homoserine efflux transporter RhtA